MINDEIIRMIEEAAQFPVSDRKINLYKDLGLDSLSFIHLLLKIEDMYSITFDITEMESCLEVGRMIELAEKKVKEKDIK
ncbi:acyl carrier protein [Lacrimispora sp.]|uniref:acyl carrier protein n=1 Tax=Lacrimispora sp. TaxID=2719234 RepID=UPI0028620F71|nr:acyl carrier protein [Lacrimispora sp.]MDR7812800.1 acyl carrier protein [Lacrimispora sp.]